VAAAAVVHRGLQLTLQPNRACPLGCLLLLCHLPPLPLPCSALQVFEFQPDPGLQTICFARPDLEEAVRELGEWAGVTGRYLKVEPVSFFLILAWVG